MKIDNDIVFNTNKEKIILFLKNEIINEFDNSSNIEKECYICHSKNIVKLGKYKGIQRYRCKDCYVSFTSNSKKIFVSTKLSKETWYSFISYYIDGLPLREIAKKINVSLKTSFLMKKRIIECLVKNDFLA